MVSINFDTIKTIPNHTDCTGDFFSPTVATYEMELDQNIFRVRMDFVRASLNMKSLRYL